MVLARLAKNRFLVLGRAGMDLYADPPGTRVEEARAFTTALGGSAANIAAGIARLGGKASLITAVSDDAVGRFVLNELKRYGIGAEYVRSVGGEARNSLAVVETRLENCQNTLYRNGAADFQLEAHEIARIDWPAFGALIVTGTALAMEPSRAATFLAMTDAGAHGACVILDIDYRPYSWASAEDARATLSRAAELSDIVVGNDVEFAVMAGPQGDGLDLARAMDKAKKIAIYKMGEKGALTFAHGKSYETGIFRVNALKPTGAGDAFMGGFVTGLAEGFDIRAAVVRGSAAAAIVVTRVGCAPAMPTAAELEGFIAEHPSPI